MVNNKMNVDRKNYSDIPVWRRYTLTIEEAAGYYHIGEAFYKCGMKFFHYLCGRIDKYIHLYCLCFQ